LCPLRFFLCELFLCDDLDEARCFAHSFSVAEAPRLLLRDFVLFVDVLALRLRAPPINDSALPTGILKYVYIYINILI
jgi:hypothetical protein